MDLFLINCPCFLQSTCWLNTEWVRLHKEKYLSDLGTQITLNVSGCEGGCLGLINPPTTCANSSYIDIYLCKCAQCNLF